MKDLKRVSTLLDLGETMFSAIGQSSFKSRAAAKDWSDLTNELRELC